MSATIAKIAENLRQLEGALQSRFKIFDLRESYGFYGAYHTNFYNKLVHLVAVPTILTCMFHFLSLLPSLLTMFGFEIKTVTLVALGLALSYIPLQREAGFAFLPMMYLAYNAATVTLKGRTLLSIFLFACAWTAQLVGHARLEQNQPAMQTNPTQALHAAPFFLWLEVLFTFGFNPKLKRSLDAEVGRRRSSLRIKKASDDGGTPVGSMMSPERTSNKTMPRS